jgi:hypothetical protein
MNPFIKELIATVLRHILTAAAGYLVTEGLLTDAQATQYVAAVVLASTSMIWAYVQKRNSRATLVTALGSPRAMTEESAKAMVKNPLTYTPPVSVPTDVVPRMTPNES